MLRPFQVLWMALTSLATIGCSSGKLPLAPAENASADYGPGGQLVNTLLDGNGETITFDEQNRTITLGTGEWLTLDPDAVEGLMTEFMGWVEADSVTSELGPSADQFLIWECSHGGYCQSLRTFGSLERTPTARAKKQRVLVRPRQAGPRPGRPAFASLLGPVQRRGGQGWPFEEPSSLKADLTFEPSFLIHRPLLANLEDGCGNFATSILQTLGPLRLAKAGHIRGYAGAVRDAVRDFGAGSIMNRFSQFMARILEIGSVASIDRATVNTMGAWWNIMGCPEQAALNRIRTGRIWVSGSSGWTPPSSWQESCSWQVWEISFNGPGGPWYPINVYVCIMQPGE